MKSQIVAIVLLSLLVNAQTGLAQSLRDKIQEIGVGEKARVVVTFHDKSRIKGYVSAVTADGFTVSRKEQSRTVAYGEVESVRKDRGNRIVAWVIVGVIGFVVTGLVVNDAQGAH